MVVDGDFRQELYYRIHVVDLKLPPLRERKEDIALLVDQFITNFNRRHYRTIQRITPEAMALLMAHNWPGNVRELENVIESEFVLCSNDEISPACLKAGLGFDSLQNESSEQIGHLFIILRSISYHQFINNWLVKKLWFNLIDL
ncbi:hypothetical protein [Vibrio alginolyticus]|uniref:hypothetical protein n=1 Tax=Vibrio alginolyticus TaxID=663 RepID=UPI0020231473|nr:hypothetical protein [Vibrio alginolyticus]WED60847.1 hypothetical protein O6P42_07165 [Vibrio alginolyticus]